MAIIVGTDTYITIVEADAIITKRINGADWVALDDTTKEQYLVDAMTPIELDNIKGCKYNEDQTLEYPRTWYLNVDTAGEVSDRVKEAQALEAFERYLMNANNSSELNALKFGVKREKVRHAEIEYNSNGYFTQRYEADKFYSVTAKMKIQPYRIVSFDRA